MNKNSVKVKNEISMKNMEYTRYISIRYSLALLLFANLNWLITLIITKSVLFFIPLLLLLSIISPVYEQIKVYSHKDLNLKNTRKYLIFQLVTNILLIILSFYPDFYNKAFPFMAKNRQGLIGILIVLGLGILVEIRAIRKINKINVKKDKVYKEVLKYEKAMKVSE